MTPALAKPLATLSREAQSLVDGSIQEAIPLSGITKLDELTVTFTQRANQLAEKSRAIIESKFQIKIHEKRAELAFSTGIFESASDYLLNVGNSIPHWNSSLLNLENLTQSTDKYPLVFKKIVDGDTVMLECFRLILVEKN